MRFSTQPNQQDDGLTTNRIEAFSDGVFAIAITLLILEIRLPTQLEASNASVAESLLAIWPSYFAYIFSFVTVGIYWINHHYIFKIYQKTNHVFNLLNVFFLMCISFLPFPTGVLGSHLLDVNEQRTTIAFYVFGLLLPALSWLLMWLYGSSNYRLIDANLSPRFVRYLTRQYGLSSVICLFAFVITLVQPFMGLAIAVGLIFLYLLPSKPPIYVDSPTLSRPPQTPLQDSILILLRESPKTKQELSEILDRPTSRIVRALRFLLIQEKIQQQIGEEMKYQLSTSDPSKTAS